MAGPILGFGQQTSFTQPSQTANATNFAPRIEQPKEKQIQPQGTQLGSSEESNGFDNNGDSAQLAAQQILAQQSNVQRGAVLDIVV